MGALILKEIMAFMNTPCIACCIMSGSITAKVGKVRNKITFAILLVSTNQAPENLQVMKTIILLAQLLRTQGSVGRLPRNESVLETAWLCGLCDLQQVNSSFFVQTPHLQNGMIIVTI